MLAIPNKVVPAPAQHARVVDASMLEEPAIFDGEHCLHQVRRNLIVRKQTPLGAVCIFAQAGDE